jgi:hypothetical protein
MKIVNINFNNGLPDISLDRTKNCLTRVDQVKRRGRNLIRGNNGERFKEWRKQSKKTGQNFRYDSPSAMHGAPSGINAEIRECLFYSTHFQFNELGEIGWNKFFFVEIICDVVGV